MASARVQETLERFTENESLLADLTDRAATAVLDWIGRQVEAADAAGDDSTFDRQTTAIRRAVREAVAVTTRGLEEEAPAAIITRAEAILRATGDPALLAMTPPVPESSSPASVPQQESPATRSRDESALVQPDSPTPASRPSADPTALLRRAPIPRPVDPAATTQESHERRESSETAHESPPRGVEALSGADESLAARSEAAPPRSFWNAFRRRWRSRKD